MYKTVENYPSRQKPPTIRYLESLLASPKCVEKASNKKIGTPITNQISLPPNKNTLETDRLLICRLADITATFSLLLDLLLRTSDINIDLRNMQRKKNKSAERIKRQVEKERNDIKVAPRKKPSPFTEFLDPVNQLIFVNRFPPFSLLLRNFVAVLLPIFVKSLAIPQIPWKMINSIIVDAVSTWVGIRPRASRLII